MPDSSNMCISVMTAPWSRVRHWSAPERLEWTTTEKTDAAEATATTTTTFTTAATDLSVKTSALFGCRSMHDLDVQNLIKIRSAALTTESYDDDDESFYSMDNDDAFAADPFDDDPTDDGNPGAMTKEEMEESLLKFWSSSAASKRRPDLRQPEVTQDRISGNECRVLPCSSDYRFGSKCRPFNDPVEDLQTTKNDFVKDAVTATDEAECEATADELLSDAASVGDASKTFVPELFTAKSDFAKQQLNDDSPLPQPDLGQTSPPHW